MDAFYASVEVRDDPTLKGKPLIIGSLPYERGVVATCSYEARKFGIHSAMNIKEAYRLCPDGVYMHPNFEKYRSVSHQLHGIWNDYAAASEYIALDEAYLDVTDTAETIEKARIFAAEIKRRVLEEQGLTCSVGLAYSKTAAKTASEEKKPNGYYEISETAVPLGYVLLDDGKFYIKVQDGVITLIEKDETAVLLLFCKSCDYILDFFRYIFYNLDIALYLL